MTPRLVLSTCPDPESAERIAAVLVEERLAACASLLPGLRSVYRWQGAVERAEETQLLIKTTADRLDALVARLHSLHPYELPEIIAVDIIGGLAPYLAWIIDETRIDPADRRKPHSEKDTA